MIVKDISIKVRDTEVKYDGREKLAAKYLEDRANDASNSPYKLKEMLVQYFKAYEDEKERLIVMMFDTKLKLIGINLVSVGCLNSVHVHMREMFRAAILCGANSIMTAHNHPSGCLEPSIEDFQLFKRAEDVGAIVGIEVLDNFVVSTKGDGKVYSDKSKETI